MVLLETPTNPLIKIVDIRGICDLVHAQNPNGSFSFYTIILSSMIILRRKKINKKIK